MDKLRAIEYFNRAIQLYPEYAAMDAEAVRWGDHEQSLGVTLFFRSRRGLALTVDGER